MVYTESMTVKNLRIRPRHLLGQAILVGLLALAWYSIALASDGRPGDAVSTPGGEAALVSGERLGDAVTLALTLTAAPTGTNVYTSYVYLPLMAYAPEACRPIPGESYGRLSVSNWQPPDRPAEQHGDLNLALRSYTPTQAALNLVDLGGDTDPGAPQLAGLFAAARAPAFTAVYQVYNWNWGCNCRGDPIDDWEVTLADLAAGPGETLHVPASGYDIGAGYAALVLYASPQRLTLKYTSEGNVVQGYTLHVENVCVEPDLLALYQTLDSAGRHELPALRAGQAFGRARGDSVGVAIRDSGAFLETRSRKDWWRGW